MVWRAKRDGWLVATIAALVLAAHTQADGQNPPATGQSASQPVLRMNAHYIAGPAGTDRTVWLKALQEYREGTRGKLDRSLYDRADLTWAARAFSCHFTFMYDRSFYDPSRGEYAIDSFLADGEREFGGYDAIVLWQGYPRLGVDDRNQFDMYRDMPGGLSGVRDLVGRLHQRGVKVFIDYNPWDTGTRRENQSDEETLADLIATIEADGIFLDTMTGTSPALRHRLDQARPGVVLEPEGHPEIAQLSLLSASWAQWLNDPAPPGLLHLKWIESRHMQHQIRRWNDSHQAEIESAFFNGSGTMIWENIFGTYNPWSLEDRRTWRRAVSILRYFATLFVSDRCDPFYPTLQPGLSANRWPAGGLAVFTLVNRGRPIADSPLIEVPAAPEVACYDLWNGRPLRTTVNGSSLQVSGSIEHLGCLLIIEEARIDSHLRELLEQQKRRADDKAPLQDARNTARSVMEPEPVGRTTAADPRKPPPGMALVPAATIRMRIEHTRRECGCYPDPETPPERWREFLWGDPSRSKIKHDYGPVRIQAFFIDEAEVSNAEFDRFLRETGYRPKHPESFLRHWPNGRMPAELADHPVVYVDLNDAAAYARWAGKRLPTEPEWQLAAQGTDGRTWPWGDRFDASRCNTTGNRTLPVRSCPEGRSPFGCYHMAGNVWEWTASLRDDNHTRFTIIRGGSYFKAEGSIWYTDGGPQPCNHHAKMILMWPGLDRCATVGFRCVRDAESGHGQAE